MISSNLPPLEDVKEYYEISFDTCSLFVYHPVTTNLHNLFNDFREVIDAVCESEKNCVMMYPNNDPAADILFQDVLRYDGGELK